MLHKLVAQPRDIEDHGDGLPLPRVLQQLDIVLDLAVHQRYQLPVLLSQTHDRDYTHTKIHYWGN